MDWNGPTLTLTPTYDQLGTFFFTHLYIILFLLLHFLKHHHHFICLVYLSQLAVSMHHHIQKLKTQPWQNTLAGMSVGQWRTCNTVKRKESAYVKVKVKVNLAVNVQYSTKMHCKNIKIQRYNRKRLSCTTLCYSKAWVNYMVHKQFDLFELACYLPLRTLSLRTPLPLPRAACCRIFPSADPSLLEILVILLWSSSINVFVNSRSNHELLLQALVIGWFRKLEVKSRFHLIN